MKSILSIYDLLPVVLLVLQTFLFLFCAIAVLRYLKILQLPYAGMEYSQLIKGVGILMSIMIIGFSDAEAVVQTVKTFHNYGDGFYRNTFIKFSQFILLLMIAECIFGFLCFIALRIIPGFRTSSAAEDDIPKAILQVLIIIIIAILMYTCTSSIIETLTPKYINFN